MLVLPLLALLLTQPGGPQAPDIHAADEAFRAGTAAVEQHDPARARAQFETVVRLAPRVGAGHSALGAVLLALGDLKAAVSELRTALEIDPSDQLARSNLAIALTRTRAFPEALRLFAAVAGGPGAGLPGTGTPFSPGALNSEGVLAYATALAESGRAPEAGAVLAAAAAADPSAWEYEDGLGTLLARQQRYAEAHEHFAKAALADTNEALPHLHLGSVELLEGHAPEAVTELSVAARLAPEDAQTLLQLGRAQFAVGDVEAAVSSLEHARRLAPGNDEIAYQLGLALEQAGQPGEALPLLAAAAARQPKGHEDSGVLTNYALALVQSGNAKDALPVYARVLAREPGNALLHENLGVAYLQQNDLDHAIEQFRAGLSAEKGGAQSAVLHYDLGLALKLKDRLPESVAELEQAEKLDPALPDPPYTLGILHMQAGQFPEAAAAFERAVSLRPENGQAWAALGSVYKQMEMLDKAVPALREAARLLPAQPGPHVLLGAILAQKGDRAEAAAERKRAADLTRVAVSRQKANFALQSGEALLKQGNLPKALEQLQAAVDADPGYAEAHRELAAALDRAHRSADAALERQKAAQLEQ